MKITYTRVTIGTLLVLAGVIFLLENLGIIYLGKLFWGVLLGAASLSFIVYFFRHMTQWWALLPGIILLTLSSQMIIDYISPEFINQYGEIYLLIGFAASFFAVYIAAPYNWWAILPGGTLLTIAGITMFDEIITIQGTDIGGGFFLGLGFTFLLVFLLPGATRQNTWAIFPSLALFLVGILILISAEEIINYIWPTIIIAIGLVLIIRNFVWE